MNVWVLIYEHRHGSDITVYATEQLAQGGAKELIEQYLDQEVQRQDARAAIRAALKANLLSDATELYNDHSGEYVTISKQTVVGLDTPSAVDIIAGPIPAGLEHHGPMMPPALP